MQAAQWQEVEIGFEVDTRAQNPYTDVDGYVRFTHESGEEIVRPIFWDGGNRFAVRFASTKTEGKWRWVLSLDKGATTRSARKGELVSAAAEGDTVFDKHGFWRIPKGERQLVHSDGHTTVMVGDTAWALPWRATPEQALKYARDRQEKGFNAALLMTIMPDSAARGPRDRTADEGFAVAFEDLTEKHINQLNPEYFQELDVLMNILREHGICPVFQPVFHGYGWKGRSPAGFAIPPAEYARFCRYLVARYGAGPSMWLVGADGLGDAPNLAPGGEEIEKWDAYGHPTGLHYAPHGDTTSHQDADWLDFQWAQTGHNGEHLPEVAMAVYKQEPVKGAANGEPTYEHMGEDGRGAGWWQGHEAWSNLCAGGTMGVVYGAASLWNWVLHPEERDIPRWTLAEGYDWEDALGFSGSGYVGNLGKILSQYPVRGMKPNWRTAPGRRGLVIPGKLVIIYAGNGRNVWLPKSHALPERLRIFDPKTGEMVEERILEEERRPTYIVELEPDEPRILVFGEPLEAGEE